MRHLLVPGEHNLERDVGGGSANCAEEARRLLSSWLRHEEEAVAISGRPSWASAQPSTTPDRVLLPTACVGAQDDGDSASSFKSAADAFKWRPPPAVQAPLRTSRPRPRDVIGTIEERLRDLHNATASSAAAVDPTLHEDFEVALGLLAERRRETQTAVASSAANSSAVAVSRRPPPAADPVLRMEARQQLIREQREARRRACSADPSPRHAPSNEDKRCPRSSRRESRCQRYPSMPAQCSSASARGVAPDVAARSNTTGSGSDRAMGARHVRNAGSPGTDVGRIVCTRQKGAQVCRNRSNHASDAVAPTKAEDAPSETVRRKVPQSKAQCWQKEVHELQTPSRDVQELQVECNGIKRESEELEAQADRLRGEVAKESQAYQELLAARQAKERNAKAVQEADAQLKSLRMQKAVADSERKAHGSGRLFFVLEVVRRRFEVVSKRAVITRLKEERSAVLAKARLAAAVVRLALLSRVAHAWHSAASAERIEREARIHIEQRLHEQRQLNIAGLHCNTRCVRRKWVAWRLFVRHAQDARVAELVKDRAARFLQGKQPETEHGCAPELDQEQGFENSQQSRPESVEGDPRSRQHDHSSTPRTIRRQPRASSQPKLARRESADDNVSARPSSAVRSMSSCSRATSSGAKVRQEPRTSRGNSVIEERDSLGGESCGALPAQARDASQSRIPRPKAVVEMERRAQSRRLAREERVARHDQQHVVVPEAAGGHVDGDAPVAEQSVVQHQACARRSRNEVHKPKVVADMERRAEERRLAREQRLERHARQEEQLAAGATDDTDGADEAQAIPTQARGPLRNVEIQRPKLVLEMERRAEERRAVREERRERIRQQEEHRIAAEREAEEAQQRQQEEERRQRVRERQERERAEQLRVAQRKVEHALLCERIRQAREFWALHRLVDVWCAFRQLALESQEKQLAAWSQYRKSLLSTTVEAWWNHKQKAKAVKQACSIARLRFAYWLGRRSNFRLLLHWLCALAEASKMEAASARAIVQDGILRRCVQAWRADAARTVAEKQHAALRQYVACLARTAVDWWRLGCEQSRVDRAMLAHKQALQEKVSSWLREMDAADRDYA